MWWEKNDGWDRRRTDKRHSDTYNNFRSAWFGRSARCGGSHRSTGRASLKSRSQPPGGFVIRVSVPISEPPTDTAKKLPTRPAARVATPKPAPGPSLRPKSAERASSAAASGSPKRRLLTDHRSRLGRGIPRVGRLSLARVVRPAASSVHGKRSGHCRSLGKIDYSLDRPACSSPSFIIR